MDVVAALARPGCSFWLIGGTGCGSPALRVRYAVRLGPSLPGLAINRMISDRVVKSLV